MNHHLTNIRRTLVIALCLGLLVAALGSWNQPAAAAPTCTTDCYVSPTGSDANDGATAATPLLSIPLAINTLSPGGTIHLAAGTYSGDTMLSSEGWRELYITKPLTMLGAGSATTIIQFRQETTGIEIEGNVNGDIAFKGLTITKIPANTTAAGFNIRFNEWVTKSFNVVTFDDVVSEYAFSRNVFLGHNGTYDEVIVTNSRFSYSDAFGFSISGTANKLTVTDSTFNNNGLVDKVHAYGLALEPGTGISNVLIKDSTFTDNGTVNDNGGTGIVIVNSTDVTIDNVDISGSFDGIKIWEWVNKTSNVVVRNSTSSGNRRGILIGSETGSIVDNVTISHNDLSGNIGAGVLIYRAAGWGEGAITNVDINRNDLSGSPTGINGAMIYEEVDGTCNWWGDASGPGPVGPGSGSGVSTDVDFAPFLTTTDLDGLCADGIFMSTTLPGTTGDGLPFGMEDIIKWDGSAWSMWFDGSAAGLAPVGKWKHNINAFYIPDPSGDDIILSFTQNRRLVPGITDLVNGMDLVRWDGTAFSLWFDGEDVGLNQMTPEKIDALHVLPGSASPIGGSCLNYLLISTQGTGRVANYDGTSLRFRGEDVLGFCMTNGGANTAGFWHMVLDGSAQGMPPNATDSISMSADGQTMYLTTRQPFNVGAASGGHSMVYTYDMVNGSFAGPIFDAPANGLPKKVDGLDITTLP